MQAIWFEEFGSAKNVLKSGAQPMPDVGADDVLVRLRTSAVNPSDVKKRAGSFPDMLDTSHCIPHSDGAGEIAQVGQNVPTSRIGERVWLYQAQFGRMFGTCAEYVSVHTSRAVPLPDNVSYGEGACLGIPAMTAHRCVFADGAVENQLVLITGGAGRVGYYAIQFATQAGATVIATASNEDDMATCLKAGAEFVVNHRADDFVSQIESVMGARKIQRVIEVEFGANLSSILDVIDQSAVIATYSSTQVTEPKLPFFRMMYLDITIRMVIVYAMPEQAKQAAIQDITEALRSRRLRHRIAAEFPLDDTALAHELVEKGTCRGCVIINVAD